MFDKQSFTDNGLVAAPPRQIISIEKCRNVHY